MERLDNDGRVYLFERADGSLYWDYKRDDEGSRMVAALSDAYDAEAERFPARFAFVRSVEHA